jgi:hypothetical protein
MPSTLNVPKISIRHILFLGLLEWLLFSIIIIFLNVILRLVDTWSIILILLLCLFLMPLIALGQSLDKSLQHLTILRSYFQICCIFGILYSLAVGAYIKEYSSTTISPIIYFLSYIIIALVSGTISSLGARNIIQNKQ